MTSPQKYRNGEETNDENGVVVKGDKGVHTSVRKKGGQNGRRYGNKAV